MSELGLFENECDSLGMGQYYYNARWYDPQTGRFITEDPARDGYNWYVYCSNNPLIFIDPTGLEDEYKVFQGIGHMIQAFTLPFEIISDLFNKKVETSDRSVSNKSVGASAETNVDILDGNLFAEAEAGVAEFKTDISAETRNKNWGIELEFHGKAATADANLGLKDNSLGFNANASLLDLGLNINLKFAGE